MPLTSSQLDRITRTVLGEARQNDPQGQAAVAWVVKNRADSGRFSSDPGQVATQGNRNGIHQFSAWNTIANGGNNGVRIGPDDPRYQAAARIVSGVFDGTVDDPTGGATFYHTPGVHPSWDRGMTRTAELGGHIFYSPHPVPPANIPDAPKPATMSAATAAARTVLTGGVSPTERQEQNDKNVPLVPAIKNASGSPGDRQAASDAQAAAKAAASSKVASPVARTVLTGGLSPTERQEAADALAKASGTTVLTGSDSSTAAQTVTVNGHIYRVGDVLKSGDYSYQVQANGTMKKMPHYSLGTNTVAGSAVGKAIGGAIETAKDKVGGFLGGLFNSVSSGGGSPTPATPAGYNQVTPAQRTAIAAVPKTILTGGLTADQARNLTPAADLATVAPSVSVPKYIDVVKKVPVPSSQPIETGDGTHWDAKLGQFVLDDSKPAAPTYKTVTVKEPNPAYKPQRVGYTSPLIGADDTTYTVRPQDTLSDIALAAFGNAGQFRQLMALNGIKDPTKLQAGQVLQLRAPQKAAPALPTANDNPAAIAARNSGQKGYTAPGGGMVPTTTVSGGHRNSYGDAANHLGSSLTQNFF